MELYDPLSEFKQEPPDPFVSPHGGWPETIQKLGCGIIILLGMAMVLGSMLWIVYAITA